MKDKIIENAKHLLKNADSGKNDCNYYNNGFIDGIEYAIKEINQNNKVELHINKIYLLEILDKLKLVNANIKICRKGNNESVISSAIADLDAYISEKHLKN